jgi:hypothetical protein
MASDIGEFVATLKFVLEGKGLDDAAKKADDAGKKTGLLDQINKRLVITFGDLQNIAKQVGAVLWSFAQAAGESEMAQKRLADAMKAQGVFSAQALKANTDYASSLQSITVYGDEAVVSAMQLLTTFGLHGEKLRTTTKAATDLASSLGIDLRSAAMLLGKAFVGETSSLSRYGIVIDENTPKTKKFEEALKQVQERFKGAAEGEAQTFNGQLQIMFNHLDELKETIGGAIIPTFNKLAPSINAAADSLRKLVQYMTSASTGSSHMVNLENELIDARVSGDKVREDLILKAIEGIKKVEERQAKLIESEKKKSLGEIQITKMTAAQILENDKKTRKMIDEGMKDEMAKHQAKEAYKRKLSQETFTAIQGMITAYSGVLNNLQQLEAVNIQNRLTTDLEAEQQRYDGKKAWIEANVEDETEKTQMLENLERDHSDKEKALQKDAQNRQKEANQRMKPMLIAQAIANTAVGVTKAFAEGGLLGFVTGALVAAAGAIEIQKIQAQQFAKGVKNFAGGWALVGEGLGEELVHLPKGSDVHTASETRRMLAGGFDQGGAVANSNQEINITINGSVDKNNVRTICNQITEAVKQGNMDAVRLAKTISKEGGFRSGEAY